IGRPYVPVLVDGESVRVGEQACPDASEKPARRVELQDRRIGVASVETRRIAGRLVVEASVKHPNVAVGSDMHPDDFSPLIAVWPLHARGRGGPIRHETVWIGERRRLWERKILPILRLRRHCKRDDDDSLHRELRTEATCRKHRGPPSTTLTCLWDSWRTEC